MSALLHCNTIYFIYILFHIFLIVLQGSFYYLHFSNEETGTNSLFKSLHLKDEDGLEVNFAPLTSKAVLFQSNYLQIIFLQVCLWSWFLLRTHFHFIL